LKPEHVRQIFGHFSRYDFRTASPEFWGPWRQLLDDLRFREQRVRFDSGGICGVDLLAELERNIIIERVRAGVAEA
jgi:hypothetical protein